MLPPIVKLAVTAGALVSVGLVNIGASDAALAAAARGPEVPHQDAPPATTTTSNDRLPSLASLTYLVGPVTEVGIAAAQGLASRTSFATDQLNAAVNAAFSAAQTAEQAANPLLYAAEVAAVGALALAYAVGTAPVTAIQDQLDNFPPVLQFLPGIGFYPTPDRVSLQVPGDRRFD